MGIFSLLKPKKKYRPEEVLNAVHYNRGMLWEKIEQFKVQLSEIQGAATHELGKPQEEDMQKHYPLKHNFEGGLYTREIFMPKGSLNVSFIHKQKHPSFLVKGKLSYLNDEGVVETIEAPHSIFTKIGAQRVFYIHEDATWICVYKTDATTPEEAEKEIYAESFHELPKEIVEKELLLCQD
jgi:hypothetical protein|tara:strand:- start:8 stop:550 length:543 start_codon:yes stop_codon:yes gene_type:complete